MIVVPPDAEPVFHLLDACHGIFYALGRDFEVDGHDYGSKEIGDVAFADEPCFQFNPESVWPLYGE